MIIWLDFATISATECDNCYMSAYAVIPDSLPSRYLENMVNHWLISRQRHAASNISFQSDSTPTPHITHICVPYRWNCRNKSIYSNIRCQRHRMTIGLKTRYHAVSWFELFGYVSSNADADKKGSVLPSLCPNTDAVILRRAFLHTNNFGMPAETSIIPIRPWCSHPMKLSFEENGSNGQCGFVNSDRSAFHFAEADESDTSTFRKKFGRIGKIIRCLIFYLHRSIWKPEIVRWRLGVVEP